MYEFLKYWVEDVMTPDPVCADPKTTIHEVERIFESHDFNGLPVVNAAGELVGIVTKLDVLKAFRFSDENMLPPYDEIMKQPVEAVMTANVRSVCPRTLLTRVLEKMIEFGVKSFPVLDGRRLVGMVAREDVLRALRRGTAGVNPTPVAELVDS
ncbi:MAG: CBS domain-containing protein [Deltaproteobacteria bacterium]|nr:MAG: CBS domain-containing protein [Deltaproteobacteria bacterium]